MDYILKNVKCTQVAYRDTSTNGNNSYWMTFQASDGAVHKGYTKPNSMISYYAESAEGKDMEMVKYRLTCSGKMVIIDFKSK